MGLSLLASFTLSVSPALAHTDGAWDGHMWDGHMGTWGGGWMGFMSILWMTLLILGGAALIYWVVKSQSGGDDALDILRQQYARGEIDHEEFEERKKRLREK